jgi:hypothetical protein
MEAMARSFPHFAGRIGERLSADDDPNLWQTAVERIIADADLLCHRCQSERAIFAQIGSCSHWMSPHNKGSWFHDVRFAWPTGYGNPGFTIFGLPEYDWFLTWKWIMEDSCWEPIDGVNAKRPLVLRVTLPARTARHVRAVAHTLWTPGSPTTPKKKLLQGYAFAKVNGQWHCAATCGNQKPYE